jgi:HlyD family secretion protein
MDIPRADRNRGHLRRRWIVGSAAGAFALAAVAGTALLGPALPQVDRNSVWIDTVKRGEMLREVRGQGVLSPKDIRWITAQTRATVARIPARPGVSVVADTTIMELTNPVVPAARIRLQRSDSRTFSPQCIIQFDIHRTRRPSSDRFKCSVRPHPSEHARSDVEHRAGEAQATICDALRDPGKREEIVQ